MTTRSVSVVVPIRNEELFIAQTLTQLLDQDTDGITVEILVVDGRSTDRTREIVSSFVEQNTNVKLLDNPHKLSSAARNVGIRNATGNYLVVIDGHCEIRNRRYFLDLVEAFERTQADCLGRPQPLDISEATIVQKAIAVARKSRLGHHPASFIYSSVELEVPAISVAVAYRKEVFEQIGLFDQGFDACEDCELNHRIDEAGMSCYLIPDLKIHYQPRGSLSGLFKQLTRYGRGRVRLARKHKNSLSLSSIVPALFLLGLIVGPLLSLIFPPLWFVYFGIVGLYLGLITAFALVELKENGWATAIRLPLVFATIHISSGWGVIREFLLPPKTVSNSK